MDKDGFDLVVIPRKSRAPLRAKLVRRLTTLGSDPAADVRIEDLPAQWAVLDQQKAGATLRLLGSGTTRSIAVGEHVFVDEVGLTLLPRGRVVNEGLPIDALVEALCGVESARDALQVLLRGLLDAAAADLGAIVVVEDGQYHVPLAEDRSGQPLARAEELLSDTIIADALATAAPVVVRDAASDARYGHVPSVMALRLRAALCVPMALGGRVLGAFFLARNDVRASFTERQAADLALLAGMVVPLLTHLRRVVPAPAHSLEGIVGESAAMQQVRRLVQRVAPSDLSVLLGGETGTGKEVVARAIHALSPRAARPMVAITCSAVPEPLLGAELFGAAKGAFTGAIANRVGKLEEAHGSTLFLDEVGDMPLSMQAALLRVLEQREVTRLGENVTRKVDFRLIAATHRDLDADVKAGRFREDLLFRLREIHIVLPPLRERTGDIELLSLLFLHEAARQFGVGARRLAPESAAALGAFGWPGNVRELRAAMRRAALLTDDGVVRPRDLQLAPARASNGTDLGNLERSLEEARGEFSSRYVAAVLARHGGNREKAAAALGISMRTLYRFL